MEAYRRHWHQVGLVLFFVLTFCMAFWGQQIDPLRYILIYSFMALLVHQYEEYAFPGGFPAIFNIALSGEKQVPERYPLNTNQVLTTNVFLAYPFYILPIFFPHLIWFGIAQMLFGFSQLIIHGVMINRKLGTLYNPGLAAVIFLHIPIGVYYLWYVATQHLAGTTDYVYGVVLFVIGAVVMIPLPIRLMSSRQSKYAFPEAMFYGFAREKLERMRRS